MKKILSVILTMLLAVGVKMDAKTLVVYYSYTNHCREIVNSLTEQISVDVLSIEPAEKGLRYDANNYAIGTQLLNAINANPSSASSYPAIDPISVNLSDYDTVIIVTPLWWSQMSAIMQAYLFQYGSQMVGKHIGLIVSSASSSISRVVSDCNRLVPKAKYFSENLWINHANHSNRSTLISDWLSTVNYEMLTGIASVTVDKRNTKQSGMFSINGQRIIKTPAKGIYIENGIKKIAKQGL